MKRFFMIVGIAVISISFSGCSYKASKSGLSKVGYEEKRVSDRKYILTYYGSGFHDKEDVLALWHKRAKELCKERPYTSDVKSDEWTFDSYTVLPPLVAKSKAAAPRVKGELQCN